MQAVETVHRYRQHLHQLAALLAHIATEHRPERGIKLEYAAVKQFRSGLRNWHDLRIKISIPTDRLDAVYFLLLAICHTAHWGSRKVWFAPIGWRAIFGLLRNFQKG